MQGSDKRLFDNENDISIISSVVSTLDITAIDKTAIKVVGDFSKNRCIMRKQKANEKTKKLEKKRKEKLQREKALREAAARKRMKKAQEREAQHRQQQQIQYQKEVNKRLMESNFTLIDENERMNYEKTCVRY